MRESRATCHAVLVLVALALVVTTALLPPMPGPANYNCLADERAWLGIPNTLNVLSNLPFALIGLLGLLTTFAQHRNGFRRLRDQWERWPYAILFLGVTLTSLGSGYYHLAPNNHRLLWDRLPMSIGFMGLFTAMLAERVGIVIARRLLAPLVAFGALSVLYWYWSWRHGRPDVRMYALVQFGSLALIVLLLLLYRAPYHGARYLIAALTLYAVAMGFDRADRQVFALGGVVSGHTLKHLTAAIAIACLVGMLRARQLLAIAARRPVPTAQVAAR